ncbi:MAG: redoxin domain-containing protein [Bacteroidales bacterium]|jgi:peroxiredoxin
MKKIIKYFVFAFCVFIVFSCKNKKEEGYHIYGKINGLENTKISLVEIQKEGTVLIDETILKNGKFEFKGETDAPFFAGLALADQKPFVNFFVLNEEIYIEGQNNINESYKVYGSEENDLYFGFMSKLDSLVDYQKLLYTYYQDAQLKKDVEKMAIIQEKYDATEENIKSTIINFGYENNNSIVTPFIVHRFSYLVSDEILAIFDNFGSNARVGYAYESLEQYVDRYKKVQIGNKFSDFSMQTSNGKIESLSDYINGNYSILVFWASWCAACSVDCPIFVDIYNKYKKYGLEVIGISLDNNLEEMLEGIRRYNLNFVQFSDLKSWQSEAAELYCVKSLAFNYLIDPNGIIIGRQMSLPDLENLLDSVYLKKN